VNENGERLRGSRDWFDPAIKASGVKDYTWHCNRHTFASRLVMAGVSLNTVTQLLGHRTIQMTMRYAHLASEHAQGAVDRLVSPSEQLVTKSVTDKRARKRVVRKSKKINGAKVAELADAPDLGSGGETHEGSSPSFRTNNLRPIPELHVSCCAQFCAHPGQVPETAFAEYSAASRRIRRPSLFQVVDCSLTRIISFLIW